LGFEVWGLRLRVWGYGLVIRDLGCGDWGAGIGVSVEVGAMGVTG